MDCDEIARIERMNPALGGLQKGDLSELGLYLRAILQKGGSSPRIDRQIVVALAEMIDDPYSTKTVKRKGDPRDFREFRLKTVRRNRGRPPKDVALEVRSAFLSSANKPREDEALKKRGATKREAKRAAKDQLVKEHGPRLMLGERSIRRALVRPK